MVFSITAESRNQLSPSFGRSLYVNLKNDTDMEKTILYHRNPTDEEIHRGYGATHYVEVPASIALKEDGRPKRWVKYMGQRLYY